MAQDQPIRDESDSGGSPSGPGTSITRAATVLPTEPEREIEWLWPGRIPLGAISLLCGDPGVGKSFLTLEIAARVSTGGPWPDDGANQRGSAIIISGEDDVGTIGSRLRWLHADLDQIRCVNGVDCRDDPKRSRSFELDRDIGLLTKLVEEMGDCRLVVIDPVSAFLGGVSENANNQVRSLLAPLAELAATYGLSVILVSHLRKKRGRALYQTLGCQAFVALPRVSWVIVVDPIDRARRILFSTKLNCGPDPGAMAFWFESLEPDDGAFILWDENVVEVPTEWTESHGGLPSRPAVQLQRAVAWLSNFLFDGAQLAMVVKLASEGHGISEATLRRACRDLGVEKVKSKGSKHGSWLWQLPTKPRSQHDPSDHPPC